ncbi:hypothetical protein EV356DRAFT_517857 [Viridothelium virens]|uniref:Wings apart-like protein C-terminal domain-containing protein n=1 Tax=Viridothelium virens TaxID=1048519 RepID=A0A6A6HM03_VIRVR|nr:hypothetical protein EV356DRAFT_517857 [Viridothelium virens]
MTGASLIQPRRKQVTYGRSTRMRNLSLRDDGTLPSLGTEKDKSHIITSGSKSWIPAAAPGKLPARAAKPATNEDRGVFDVPSSDDEELQHNTHGKKPVQIPKRKIPEIEDQNIGENSPGDATSTESSDGSRKRKRTTPSQQLQGELDRVAREGQRNLKASVSTTSASKKPSLPASRQGARTQPLKNKSLESKKNDRQATIKPNGKTRGGSTFASSSSAPAMLQNMLENNSTISLPTKNVANIGNTPTMRNRSSPVGDKMELDLNPSTPPSLSPDRSGTPSQMLLNTPRQSLLWQNLLKDDDDLQEKTTRPGKRSATGTNPVVEKVSRITGPLTSMPQPTVKPNASLPPRRTKLVHSLIGHRPRLDPSSEEEEESDDGLSESEDIIMEEPPQSLANAETESGKTVPTEAFTRRPGMTQIGGPKITYAEKRSFLSAPQTDLDQILAAPLDDFGFGSQSQQSMAHSQGSVMPNTQDLMEEESQEEEGPSMRSAHELQALGSNRRFVDKLDALLDDINQSHGTSKSAQRSALLELGEKMMAKDFLTRLLHLDYDRKLFSHFTGRADPIADFIWTAMVAIIANGGASSHVLQRMCQTNLASSLVCQLTSTRSIAATSKERKLNMSKIAREDLMKFRESLCQETIWVSRLPHSLSPRLMALKSLDLLIRKSRESDDMKAILRDEHVKNLVSICYEGTKQTEVASQSPDNDLEAELALSILESDSIHLAGATAESNWTSETLRDLAGSTTALLGASETTGGTIESLLLRLLLNLTNNNSNVCEIFGSSDIVAALATSVTVKFAEPFDKLPEETRVSLLDRLILCLGTLINLAEFSEKARMSLVADGDDLIRGLLDTFAVGLERSTQAESIEQTQINVAYGYLAVYLADLCESRALRRRIRIGLPGQRMESLITAVQEFIKLNMMVDREKYDGDEGQAVLTAFTARFQTVLSRLRASID